jgi:tetratricopeptide (TPR) repeat protein
MEKWDELGTELTGMHGWSGRQAVLLAALLLAAPSVVAQSTDTRSSEQTYTKAMHLFHAGDYQQALPLFVSELDVARSRFGLASSEHATALNNLGEVYRQLGELEKAEEQFVQALAIEEARLGTDDPWLAKPLNNLALVYRAQERYQEAERNLKRSLQILEDSLGYRHPDVAGSLNNLARLYETTGHPERAEPLLQRALMIARNTLGDAHPTTQHVQANLDRVSGGLVDPARAERRAGPPDISPPMPRAAPRDAATDVAEAAAAEALIVGSVSEPRELLIPPSMKDTAGDDAMANDLQVAQVVLSEEEMANMAEPIREAPSVETPSAPLPAEAAGTTGTPALASDSAEPDASQRSVEADRAAAAAAAETAGADAATETAEADAAPSDIASVEPAAGDALAIIPTERPEGLRWPRLPDGRFAIHLASVRSPISATEEWLRLRDQFSIDPDLDQLEPERIEVLDQGVFYRVMAGPFATRDAAAAACDPLRRKDVYCGVLGGSD